MLGQQRDARYRQGHRYCMPETQACHVDRAYHPVVRSRGMARMCTKARRSAKIGKAGRAQGGGRASISMPAAAKLRAARTHRATIGNPSSDHRTSTSPEKEREGASCVVLRPRPPSLAGAAWGGERRAGAERRVTIASSLTGFRAWREALLPTEALPWCRSYPPSAQLRLRASSPDANMGSSSSTNENRNATRPSARGMEGKMERACRE